jgi:hypothetical protein
VEASATVRGRRFPIMAAMLRRAAPTVGGASDAHRLRLGDEATDHPTIEPDKLDMFWQQQARCCARTRLAGLIDWHGRGSMNQATTRR